MMLRVSMMGGLAVALLGRQALAQVSPTLTSITATLICDNVDDLQVARSLSGEDKKAFVTPHIEGRDDCTMLNAGTRVLVLRKDGDRAYVAVVDTNQIGGPPGRYRGWLVAGDLGKR